MSTALNTFIFLQPMNSAQDDITATTREMNGEEPRVVIENTNINPENLLSAKYEVS